jgi:hypothetical protein
LIELSPDAGTGLQERIFQEWSARWPRCLRDAAPAADEELRRLAGYGARVLQEPGSQVHSQVQGAVRAIIRAVGEEATASTMLRCLRDELVRVLYPHVRPDREAMAALTEFANRVGDAVWSARTGALKRAIARQKDERLEEELLVAKRIQQRLLPRQVPAIPGFDVADRVLAAREVGGDYWSVKEYPEDGIVTFKLADVTGHGIAAATLVAAVKYVSGGFYRGAKSAAQVMERTNHVLAKETPSDIMVSMVYGWLFPLSKEATVVNAGHETVFVCRADGRIEEIPPTGIVLGLMEARYAETRISFKPGDLLFACSDGITAPADERLGQEQVAELVRAHRTQPAGMIAQHVLDAALAFYGTPRDDMSLIVLKRTDSAAFRIP